MENSPGAGPAPAPPATDAAAGAGQPRPGLGSGPRRVLALLVEAGTPLDVAQVSAALGGHPNTARFHLETLAGQRLVRRAARATGRRGRPRLAYEVTMRGRLAGAPAALEQLLGAFAEHLATASDPASHALAVGRLWGSMLARDASADCSPSDRVLALLEHAGFSPRPGRDPAGLRVALRTCPLLDAARAHPDVVCEMHRGMVSGALAASGQPSADVSLEPFAEPGACRLRVSALGPPSDGRGEWGRVTGP